MQEEEQAEQLVNFCLIEKEITTDEVKIAVGPLMDRLNHIIYTTFKGSSQLSPVTLIEYFFNELVLQLNFTTKQNAWFSSQKNLFTILDYLCFSEKIDRRLPIANKLNTSVEKHITKIYDYAKMYLEKKTFNTIALLSQETAAKSMYARPPEHPHIISGLASVFLFPSEQKKAVIKHENKIKKEFFGNRALWKLVDAFKSIAEKQKTKFRNNLIKIIVVIILTFTATIITLKRLINQ